MQYAMSRVKIGAVDLNASTSETGEKKSVQVPEKAMNPRKNPASSILKRMLPALVEEP